MEVIRAPLLQHLQVQN